MYKYKTDSLTGGIGNRRLSPLVQVHAVQWAWWQHDSISSRWVFTQRLSCFRVCRALCNHPVKKQLWKKVPPVQRAVLKARHSRCAAGGVRSWDGLTDPMPESFMSTSLVFSRACVQWELHQSDSQRHTYLEWRSFGLQGEPYPYKVPAETEGTR